MRQYLDLIKTILSEGSYKPNRTGIDTVSFFGSFYKINLENGFPLLTTKKMDGYRWNSLIYEFLWYLSGEEHIKNLREKTKIWDAWADNEGKLQTAYGRFWRRFPIPEKGLNGEVWADNEWTTNEENGKTFDQIKYAIDTLKKNPNSRRIVVSAWHPANAAVSLLPPCHYSFVFSVHEGKLNLHLTQRSGDAALGIPFNIAAYSMLDMIIANQTGLMPGTFAHTVVDSHIYCGEGNSRGKFYEANLPKLKTKLAEVQAPKDFLEIKNWILSEAPKEVKAENLDHIPNLLEQLSREPKKLSQLFIAPKKLDELVFEDIQLKNYDSHPGIKFAVAE
ncbi:MAG: thymidylate synthase [archaeon]|nr:thymidylate synthase [archaeon]